jgi:hypothetical protein
LEFSVDDLDDLFAMLGYVRNAVWLFEQTVKLAKFVKKFLKRR